MKKKYELSCDGVGLLCYFTKTNYYHIPSDEMTVNERKVHARLKNK